MSRIGVMQITDSLRQGGLERVAVHLANGLPRSLFVSHLCSTREQGPLIPQVNRDVQFLYLKRRSRWDMHAIHRLVAYIRRHRIALLHAHGSSLFVSVAAAAFRPHPPVVWHDHFGRCETEQRPLWLYRPAVHRADAVIAVNERLVEWARTKLGVAPEKVSYVRNFACPFAEIQTPVRLPGQQGSRVVCVANMRAQKDHASLIAAMEIVVRDCPGASLILVGNGSARYVHELGKQVQSRGLHNSVWFLGAREDVGAILRTCDVGVLSSVSEGLPLAILEYGAAGLPVVATSVGECAEVLDNGGAGVLVPPAQPRALAQGLVALLRSDERRRALGARLAERVRTTYSIEQAVRRVCAVYRRVLR